MDDQDKALNQEGEVETTPDATPATEETTEVQETPTEPEEESTKKGYSHRVRELNQRAKDAETGEKLSIQETMIFKHKKLADWIRI